MAETNGSEANFIARTHGFTVIMSSDRSMKTSLRSIRVEQIAEATGVGEDFLVAGPHVPSATIGREPTPFVKEPIVNEVMQTIGASVMGVTVGWLVAIITSSIPSRSVITMP